MQISTRIVLGLAIMVLLIAAGSLYTYSATNRLTMVVSRLLAQEFPALNELDAISALVTEIHADETRMLSQDTPPDRRPFDNACLGLQKLIGELHPLPYIANSRSVAADLRSQTESLLTLERQIVDLEMHGNEFDARQLATAAVEARLRVLSSNMQLRNLYKSYIEETESQNLRVGARLRDISVQFAAISTVTALLIMLVGVRSIVAPLRRLVRVTKSIADGKTEVRAEENSTDEFGYLGKSFNYMVQNLHQRIEEVGAKNRIMQEADMELRRQLRLAQQVQKRIVPRHIGVDGLDVFSRILAARMIGGDFYDVHNLDRSGKQIGLVIGDASGSGIPAALVMVLCLTVLREASRQVFDPAQILDRVNRGIREQFPEELLDAYVTASYVALDLENMRVRVANAGHIPPLLFRIADSSVVSMSTTEGFFLGSFDDTSYDSVEFAVQAGDSIMLFTDGLTETRNPQGDFYGSERLEKLFGECGQRQCKDLGELILSDVAEFRGDPTPQDDVAILLVRIQAGTDLDTTKEGWNE